MKAERVWGREALEVKMKKTKKVETQNEWSGAESSKTDEWWWWGGA